MNAQNNQPQGLIHIFLNSFSLFKKTYVRLFPLTIFLAVIIFSPSLIIYNPLHPALFIGYFIFSIFVFSSAIYYTAHKSKGENIELKRSMLIAGEKLLLILATTVIAMVATLLGYGFLIIPGIIVTVWFSMCLPLILLEHAGPFNALRKSYELTTDDWSRTAVVVFCPVIISSLMGFIITEIFLFYKISVLYYEIILGVFVFFASLIYLPWVAALLILQFEDLKKRKALRELNARLLSLGSVDN